MRKILVVFILLPFISFGQCFNNVSIGSGNANLPKLPVYGLYDYSQAGLIYTASELTNSIGGSSSGFLIGSISFEFSGWNANYYLENQKIKIGHTSAVSFPYTSYPDYRTLTITDFTTVKDSFNLLVNNGWITIFFDTPFFWNGIDNLLISWDQYLNKL